MAVDFLQTLTHHRYQFYREGPSTFDLVEPCAYPQPCIGCMYNRPRCDDRGRMRPPEPPQPERDWIKL